MPTNNSAKITLWVNRSIFVLLIFLCLGMPWLLRWYIGVRPLGENAARAIFIGFYLCMPPVMWALWQVEKLLKNILSGGVFTLGNVGLIRHIRLSCVAVAGISLICGCFYPPLLFLAVIMGFLSLVVSVVESVMAAATKIREENDLTV